jgi:hypothetical protein
LTLTDDSTRQPCLGLSLRAYRPTRGIAERGFSQLLVLNDKELMKSRAKEDKKIAKTLQAKNVE